MGDIREEWRLSDMERKLQSIESRLYQLDEIHNLRQQLSNANSEVQRIADENSNLRYDLDNLNQTLCLHLEEHEGN